MKELGKLLVSVLFVVLFFSTVVVGQQKRSFTPGDYPGMLNITGKGLSDNGRYVYHVVSPMQYGDPYIVLYDLSASSFDTIFRSKRIWFGADGGWYAYLREPAFAEVRAAKLKDPKAAEKFDDTLVVVVTSDRAVREFIYPAAETVITPVERDHELLAALLKVKPPAEEPADSVPDSGEEIEIETDMGDQLPQRRSGRRSGNDKKLRLLVLDPVSGWEMMEADAVSAEWSPSGKYLAWVSQPVDTLPAQHLQLFSSEKLLSEPLHLSEGFIRHTTFSFSESKIAFTEQADTSDDKTIKLFTTGSLMEVRPFAIEPVEGMVFNPHHSPFFLEKNDMLVFHLSYPSEKQANDSLLREERYSVDIWAWNDPLIQSQQLKQLDTEKKRSYRAIYDFDKGSVLQLEDSTLRTALINRQQTSEFVIARDDLRYAIESTWKGGTRYDLYLINLKSGEKKLISEAHERSVSISPDESHLVWYDRDDSTWKAMETATLKSICLTCDIDIPFYNELHDNPSPAPAYGFAGWGDNGRFVMLNSRYDIWRFDLQQKVEPLCMTTVGERSDEVVYRLMRLENRKYSYAGRDRMMLYLFDRDSKASGYAEMRYNRPGRITRLIYDDYRFSFVEKARLSDQMIWQRESFNEFPEIWTDKITMKSPIRVSNVGKQYEQFYRGTVSLVKWDAGNGRMHEGLYYLPENRTEGEKLPMIVSFYERQADHLHRFNHFAPSRSVANIPEYLSHGYAFFEPDIHYNTGTPGEDALLAVVSGTRHVLSLGDVDSTRLGIQGQSWGGYQVAYIVTQTDMFAAAMAGAAVSNMTSAYGAIRWESGRARLFQYEEGQSRLGTTLWDNEFRRYCNNSPLFFANQMNTPLLMMHNDDDGAVPWSQSIEFYLALRRLSKPSWLLVYNNDGHNLRKWPNRVDLSIRMKQFFDHYLKEAPAPLWMTEGRPATLKGINNRYRFAD